MGITHVNTITALYLHNNRHELNYLLENVDYESIDND